MKANISLDKIAESFFPFAKQFVIACEIDAEMFAESVQDTVSIRRRFAFWLIDATSNYKSVFFCESDTPFPQVFDWQFRSCHDSCWRSDGFRDAHDLWFAARGELIEKLDAAGEKKDRLNIHKVNDGVVLREIGLGAFIRPVKFTKKRSGDYSYVVEDFAFLKTGE